MMAIFTFLLTLLSLVGVWLNIKKHRGCFFIWIITNGCWAAYDFMIDAFWQGILFSVYFVVAIYGLIEWRKRT